MKMNEKVFDNYSFNLFINRENLINNIKYLEKIKRKEVLPVIKADAYGHDSKKIVKILYECGIRKVVVARYIEAFELLELGLEGLKILVFESLNNYNEIVDYENIIVTINDLDELKKALSQKIPASRMQLKIDFGFGRNGILEKYIDELKEIIIENNLYFDGIYSHLFSVEYDEGLEYIQKFKKILSYLGKERFLTVHLQNSASIISYDCDFVTHIRCGMLMYGLQENGFFDRNLQQVFSLKGRIASIRNLKNKKYIAYDTKENLGAENCDEVAKIKIGYGDGFLKINENTKCLIKNKEYRIISVTMDNSFIEADSFIKVGDEVELYYDITKTKHHTRMEIHELLCILGKRIKRLVR